MWRDEVQTFVVALHSSSIKDLLSNLKFEVYPPLWYLLVWLVTRATADPISIQILHVVLAVGVWTVIYGLSPFSRLEKILLLSSYFLFWEYFVISRCYVLIALFAYCFVALRERKPQSGFVHWLLLGLLANVHLFGTIWSIVLAGTLGLGDARRRSVHLAGATVYITLLLIAVVIMRPPPQYTFSDPTIRFDVARLNADVATPLGAFVPWNFSSVGDAISLMISEAGSSIPHFWNVTITSEYVDLTKTNSEHPIRLLIVFAAPIVACWFGTRNWLLVLEFAGVYLGILLVENIWDLSGGARHHGVIFLAFIGVFWSARAFQPESMFSRRLLLGILFVNAIGGALSLASEMQPFSEGYNTAAWIKQNGLTDAFIIGSHDAQVSTVAAYLGRPIYYLECECSRPVGLWDPNSALFGTRRPKLTDNDFAIRLRKAAVIAGKRDTILIRSQPLAENDLVLLDRITAILLTSLTNASTDEDFWVYRLTAS